MKKFIKNMVKNPCDICLVKPACNIHGSRVPYHLKRKCDQNTKYKKKLDDIDILISKIEDVFSMGIFISVITFIVATFVMGIIYQIKLIF